MKRRTLALLVCIALAVPLCPAALGANSADVVVLQIGNNKMAVDAQVVQVDDQSVLVAPIAESGRTLVPVSRIVNAFGGKSTWDPKTNATTFTLDGKTVSHVIGTSTIQVDGKTISMDVPSKALNNRTYVPARFVLEGLDLHVGYEPGDQLVVVSRQDLSGTNLGSLSQSMRVSGRMGDLSAIGTRPCVPDLMAYFGLEERDYEIEPVENFETGDTVGRRVEAELKLVNDSDKQLLDGFVSVLEEFGFQLAQVDGSEQDLTRFGWYNQTFYFRYTGPGADEIPFLGESFNGEEYHFIACYDSYYESGGSSRKRTEITYKVADGLEVIATGVTDGDWNVEPIYTETLPSRPARTVVYAQNGKTTYVPDVMAYFGLGAEGYAREETDGGYTLRANLELVVGSDKRFLNEFVQIMQEQGFQFKHVATAQSDLAQFGHYAQSLYFRYVGLDADKITHLGEWDGKDYDLCLNYCNYYAATGSGRDHTTLSMRVSKDLELVDTGVRDSKWKVTPEVRETDTGTGSGGGSWTPTPTKPGGIGCGVCGGSGEGEWGSCSGRGYFERRKSTPNYSGSGPKYYTVKEPCGACMGKGKKPCTACGGDGKIGN